MKLTFSGKTGVCLAVITTVMLGGAGALAMQSTLSQVGIATKEIESWAVNDVGFDSVTMPPISSAARKLVKALTPEQRAALVRESAALTKATLMSPAFQTGYAATIRKSHRAVDHGIDPKTFGMNPTEADMQAMAIVPVISVLRTFPHAQVKTAFDEERAALAETIKEETGEERAKAQKYLTKLNALAPLAASNPEEFKKQYTLAKSAHAGGPDTEAKLQAFATGQEDQARMRGEQEQWNRWNLHAVLKRKLTAFITAAGQVDSVDFKAATRAEKDKVVFVNPAHEQQNWVWKAIYRVGRAPTVVALDFARSWLKELK